MRNASPLLAFGAIVAMACGPKHTTDPEAGAASSAQDAQAANSGVDGSALPAFDFSAKSSEPAAADPGGLAVPHERFKVKLGDAPRRGPKDAPITIVMYSDFECPYCRQGYETIKALELAYPDRLRVAYRAFPLDFHPNALMAAMVARSAQSQGRFWPLHDLLFSGAELDPQQLFSFAERVGVDMPQMVQDLDDMKHAASVMGDLRSGRKIGVDSTPTFFVNGRRLRGAVPVPEFRAVIDEELKLAERWEAAGVARADLYAHATAGGYDAIRYTERGRLHPDMVLAVPIGDSPTLGPDDAPVTIVAFSDFECPFCARGNATVDRIRARYGDRIRVVHKHNPLPFHPHAFLAARASMAAHAQGKFWRFHDELYKLRARFDDRAFAGLARRAGLDRKRFDRDWQSTKYDAAIAADLELAGSLGVTGTPTYFINGRPLPGAVDEVQMRLVVEEEFARAAKLLDAGTKPADLYERLTHTPLE